VTIDSAAASLQVVKDVAGIVGSIVQATALVVAGVWAYYWFVRGRTFFSRVDWSIELHEVTAGGRTLIHVRVSLRNAGASRLVLHDPAVVRRVAFLPPTAVVLTGRSRWQTVPPAEGSVAGLFEWQESIEPGETVQDETLIPVPSLPDEAKPLAWRVTMTLMVRRRALRRSNRLVAWPASAIVVPEGE
jgi:hypothetical protein